MKLGANILQKHLIVILLSFSCMLSFNAFAQCSFTPSYSTQDLLCKNDSSGWIKVILAGSDYTYNWSTSDTTDSIFSLSADSFFVSITDTVLSCIVIDTIVLSEPDSLLATSLLTDVICTGDSSGQIILSINGGIAPYDILWSTSDSTDTLKNLNPGSYVFDITDSNGCLFQDSALLESVFFVLDSIFEPLCSGDSSGMAFLSVFGDSGKHRTTWFNGDTIDTLYNITAGTYNYTIKDSSGSCVIFDSIIVAEPDTLKTSPTSLNSCFGDSNGQIILNITGGIVPYDILWNTSDTSDTISGLSADIYSYMITDSAGCLHSDSVSIMSSDSINLSASIANPSCFGDSNGVISLNITNGSSPFQYSWNNGDSTDSIFGLNADTFMLSLTDSVGCVFNDSFILENNMISLSFDITNISCLGDSNGSIMANVTGGFFPYTYSWNTGDSLALIDSLMPDTYILQITDSTSCSVIDTAIVSDNGSILDNDSINHISCFGLNDGWVRVNPSGGVSPYVFTWNILSSSDSIGGLDTGIYVLEITDSLLCKDSFYYTINEPSMLTDSVDSTNIFCIGDSTGSIQLFVNGGISPYLYAWSNSDSVNNPDSLNVGTYIYTITDSNSCIIIDSVSLFELQDTTTIADSLSACNGNLATLDPNPLVIFDVYSWSTGDTDSVIYRDSVGDYYLTVTDSNSCMWFDTTYVGQGTAFITQVDTTLCLGDSLMLTDSTSGYTYSWSTGENTDSIIVKPDNTTNYRVTVYDGDSYCSDNVGITLNIVDLPDTIRLCNTSSYILDAGSNFVTFNWSTLEATQTISVDSTNSYYVTATDAFNCTTNDSNVTSFVNANISPDDTLICFGDTISLYAKDSINDIGNHTYTWSTLESTESIQVSPANSTSYSVSITDNISSCSATRSVLISKPEGILNDTSYTCPDDSLTLIAGIGYSGYAWSTLETSSSIVVNSTGSYFVTITDSINCLAYDSTYFDFLVTQIMQSDTLICYDDTLSLNTNFSFGDQFLWSNASFANSVLGFSEKDTLITMTVSNHGASCSDSLFLQISNPLANLKDTLQNCKDSTLVLSADSTYSSYLWSTNEVDYYINIDSAATYYLTITDSLNCERVDSSIVLNPTLVSISSNIKDACYGDSTGQINISILSGTPAFTYVWDSSVVNISGNGSQATGLSSGQYYVSIYDAYQCGINDTFNVNEPAGPVSYNIGKSPITCLGDTNSFAWVNSSGGFMPHTYIWSGNGINIANDTIDSLKLGIYYLTIQDSLLCESLDSIEVSPALNLMLDLDSIDVSCFSDENGQVNAPISGGFLPIDYLWNNNSISDTLTNLSGGMYILTITDNYSCVLIDSILVNEPDTMAVSFTKVNISCHDFDDGYILANISGGNGGNSFLWGNGNIVNSIGGLSEGFYNISVTDSVGCSVFDSISINNPPPISSSLSIYHPTCYNNNDGSIVVTKSGGTGNLNHVWFNGSTLDSIYALNDGTYNVIITDSFGCQAYDTATLIEPSLLNINMNQIDILCNGFNTGMAWADVSGGTQPYTYLWNSGDTTDTISNIYGGLHFITVTDSNNCESTKLVNIIQPPLIKIIKDSANNICNGTAIGHAKITVSGGVGGFVTLWNDSQTVDSIGGLQSGIYSVTVTDTNNCEKTSTFNIIEPDSVIGVITKSNITCNGLHNGFASIQTSGGTSPYNYLWSNSIINSSIINLYAGQYSITITDQNSCKFIDSFNIDEPDPLLIDTSSKQIIHVDCNNPSGTISNINTSGGTSPYYHYWYESDSSFFDSTSTLNEVNSLTTGKYFVIIKDKNGCSRTIGTFFIDENLSVGAYTNTDTVYLKYGYNATLSAYGADTYLWTPNDYLNCDTCSTVIASPNETTLYTVFAGSDSTGCVDELKIYVEVGLEPEFYIPNAITPNEDGKNDLFYIYGTYIESIYYEIFDRWGELIYIGQGIDDSWDGTYKGKKLNSGVFVVKSKIKFINNTLETPTTKLRLIR